MTRNEGLGEGLGEVMERSWRGQWGGDPMSYGTMFAGTCKGTRGHQRDDM